MTDHRLTAIEIKLSQQEDLVESLNEMVYRQQKKIDALEALCAALARRMQQGTDGERAPGHDVPPHY